MSNAQGKNQASHWTSSQAYTLSVVCLLIGLVGGWFVRGSQSTTITAGQNTSASVGTAEGTDQPSPEQMRRMADKQAAPLLEQLQKEPANTELLARIGNVYYDTQQFPIAIDYYQRSLKVKPSDAAVRTDMATAYWYTGNPDLAVAEFHRALADEPNKPNTLFNLGIVQWQGKMDIKGALASWQRLLDTNPNYEGKAKVVELMAQVKKHAGMQPATQAKTLGE